MPKVEGLHLWQLENILAWLRGKHKLRYIDCLAPAEVAECICLVKEGVITRYTATHDLFDAVADRRFKALAVLCGRTESRADAMDDSGGVCRGALKTQG